MDFISQYLRAWESSAVCNWVRKCYFLSKRGKYVKRRLRERLFYSIWKFGVLSQLVIQWKKRRRCSIGVYRVYSCFFYYVEEKKKGPEGTVLKTTFYYTKQWAFPGEPCFQFVTSVWARKKNFFRKMSPSDAPCDKSLWQHKWVAPVVHSLPFQK